MEFIPRVPQLEHSQVLAGYLTRGGRGLGMSDRAVGMILRPRSNGISTFDGIE